MRTALERGTRGRREALQALNAELQKLRPQAQLLATRKALHQLAARLQSAAALTFRREREGLSHWRDRLQHVSPKPAAHAARGMLQNVKARLPMLAKAAVGREKAKLLSLQQRLTGLDPERVLTRGYAIALMADGRALRSHLDAKAGDQLTLRLQRGEVDVTVTRSRETAYTGGRDD
jgi:exodeoxyribonuclease VII large subunit